MRALTPLVENKAQRSSSSPAASSSTVSSALSLSAASLSKLMVPDAIEEEEEEEEEEEAIPRPAAHPLTRTYVFFFSCLADTCLMVCRAGRGILDKDSIRNRQGFS